MSLPQCPSINMSTSTHLCLGHNAQASTCQHRHVNVSATMPKHQHVNIDTFMSPPQCPSINMSTSTRQCLRHNAHASTCQHQHVNVDGKNIFINLFTTVYTFYANWCTNHRPLIEIFSCIYCRRILLDDMM